jgi:hypothetical protein
VTGAFPSAAAEAEDNKLPPRFRIAVYAADVPNARQMALGPPGGHPRVYLVEIEDDTMTTAGGRDPITFRLDGLASRRRRRTSGFCANRH